MRKVKDLTSHKYGRWTVLSFAESRMMSGRKRVMWNCICECGVEDVIRGENLKSGATQSCGCLVMDTSKKHGMFDTKIYKIWNSMIQRCTNANNKKYNIYGGRGITVCDRWLNSFESFYTDMGDKPEGMSLDRRDNSKGYSKSNCRWANASEQAINSRPRHNKTGVRGVSIKRNKFHVTIKVNYKNISLGSYFTIEEATKVRRAAELKYFGEYCPTE